MMKVIQQISLALLIVFLIVSCGKKEKPKVVEEVSADRQLQTTFEEIAGDNGVPSEILLAVAKFESDFESHKNTGLMERHVQRRGFGIMNLTEEMDPKASTLTNEENIKVYANILKREADRVAPKTLKDWASAASTVSNKEDFAKYYFLHEVIELLRSGFYAVNLAGQRLTLEPQKLEGEISFDYDKDNVSRLVKTPCEVIGIPCTFEPASEKNIIGDVEALRTNREISQVVFHACETNFTDCVSWFKNPISGMSSHFVISASGTIVQMVNLKHLAQDMADPSQSAGSISVFIAGRTGLYQDGNAISENPSWISDEAYVAAAELVLYLSGHFQIPMDVDPLNRQSFLTYSDIAPEEARVKGLGRFMDWEYFLRLLEVKRRELPSALEILSPAPGSSVGEPMPIDLKFSKDIEYVDIYFDDKIRSADGWYRFITFETGDETEWGFSWRLSKNGVGQSTVRWMLVKGYDTQGKLVARKQSYFILPAQ